MQTRPTERATGNQAASLDYWQPNVFSTCNITYIITPKTCQPSGSRDRTDGRKDRQQIIGGTDRYHATYIRTQGQLTSQQTIHHEDGSVDKQREGRRDGWPKEEWIDVLLPHIPTDNVLVNTSEFC